MRGLGPVVFPLRFQVAHDGDAEAAGGPDFFVWDREARRGPAHERRGAVRPAAGYCPTTVDGTHFLDVAVHVTQPERIARLPAHRVTVAGRVCKRPGDTGNVPLVVAGPPPRRGA